MNDQIRIRDAERNDIAELASITHDCVAGGASIGFMQGTTIPHLTAFWEKCFVGVDQNERAILVAVSLETGIVVGTAQLILAMPDNQPHRADVAKLQVHRNARHQGVAGQLMQSLEERAIALGRTLLVLDTVTDSSADRLYRNLGWEECGEIPNYALMPNGEFCSTTVFYKQLAGKRAPRIRGN